MNTQSPLRFSAISGGTFGFDAVLPLNADDDTISAAVDAADLPALLAALFVLTGNAALIANDLIPPRPPMLARVVPQGGMSETAQKKARLLAAQTIREARNHGWKAGEVSDETLVAAISFMTNGAADDYMDLLRHEISLPDDMGAPDWSR